MPIGNFSTQTNLVHHKEIKSTLYAIKGSELFRYGIKCPLAIISCADIKDMYFKRTLTRF
jgi:hypothetical protein